MAYYSHPHTLLVDHITQVQKIARSYNPDLEEKLVDSVTICHDFGKYTSFFQDRLFGREGQENSLGNHSFISALFGAYVGMKNSLEPQDLLCIYNVINSHHSRIKNYYAYLPINRRKFEEESPSEFTCLNRLMDVDAQLNNMAKHWDTIKSDFDQYDKLSTLQLKDALESFMVDRDGRKAVLMEIKKFTRLIKKKKVPDLYWKHQLLFSLLVSADKMSASGTKRLEVTPLAYGALMEGRAKVLGVPEKTPMNQWRQEIFDQVIQSVTKQDPHQHLFSITAPTGTGKTMTGYFAAQALKKNRPSLKKIVYVLPFTAIIDQNYKVVKKIMEASGVAEQTLDAHLMKHHYLSFTENPKEIKGEMYTSDQCQLLLENWEAETIVTTFVQLLESIIGAKNKMVKKVHALENAIIILDEIQAVDAAWYPMLDYVFKKIIQWYHCNVILMTATKPLFFPDTVELLESHKQYFSVLNRTKIITDFTPMDVDTLCEKVILNRREESLMIVVNTIQASLDIYAQLRDAYGKAEIRYLSTNLIPHQRKQRIDEIGEDLRAGKPIVLVTTQVVEAGVDLSFDCVIRDLAPLDSIIQCAGRCNRHNDDKKQGSVYVCQLVNANNRPLGGMIYGTTALACTRDCLGDKAVREEKIYLELIEAYYQLLKDNISQSKSQTMIEAMETLNFDDEDPEEVGSFSLIGHQNGKVDVYVCVDAQAVTLLHDLHTLYATPKNKDHYQALQILNKKMQGYYLALPEKYIPSTEAYPVTQNFEIPIIPLDGLEEMYCLETGFVRNAQDAAMFIL